MLRSKNNNLIWNGSGPRLETGHPVIGYLCPLSLRFDDDIAYSAAGSELSTTTFANHNQDRRTPVANAGA